MEKKYAKFIGCIICVAIFLFLVGLDHPTLSKNVYNQKEAGADVSYGLLCKIPWKTVKRTNTVNGSCTAMFVYPCQVLCCKETNSGPVKEWFMEYKVQTLMNANRNGWEIMGGKQQAGSNTFCSNSASNAGWTTSFHMEYPACCKNAPSSNNRPGCWIFDSHNLNSRAMPQDPLHIGNSNTVTYSVGFNLGFGYEGVGAGLQLTDSNSVTYAAICIFPTHLSNSCLEYKTSDNYGATTSSYITTFSVYMGSAIQISNEWTHIFICEYTNYVSTSYTHFISSGGYVVGEYSRTIVQVGGGFNFNA